MSRTIVEYLTVAWRSSPASVSPSASAAVSASVAVSTSAAVSASVAVSASALIGTVIVRFFEVNTSFTGRELYGALQPSFATFTKTFGV